MTDKRSEGQFEVKDLQQVNTVDPYRDARAAQFINAKGLNKVNKSRGETVAGNIAKALDLSQGPGSEARDKSLDKTYNISGGYGANKRGTPWTKSDKKDS
jgi:hypothetical protein